MRARLFETLDVAVMPEALLTEIDVAIFYTPGPVNCVGVLDAGAERPAPTSLRWSLPETSRTLDSIRAYAAPPVRKNNVRSRA